MQFPKLLAALAALGTASLALAEPPQPGEAENPGGEYGLMGQPGAETLNTRAQQADPTQGRPAEPVVVASPSTGAPDPGALSDVSRNRAFDLPATAARLRAAGFSEREVEQALDAAHEGGIDPADASALFETMLTMPLPASEQALGELGDVVEESVEEGLRGQALLTAIHADLMARAAAETKDGTQYEPAGQRPITAPAERR